MIEQLINKLQEQRNQLQQLYPAFPYMCCGHAQERLNEELNLVKVYGVYKGILSDDYKQKTADDWSEVNLLSKGIPHNFNYDPETRLFVDITADQFHDALPSILLMKINDKRVALSFKQMKPQTTHCVVRYL